MGINLIGSSSSADKPMKMGHAEFHPYQAHLFDMEKRLQALEIANNLQPRADKYVINKALHVNNHLILIITYENCNNYEGKKILLYKNTDINNLLLTNKHLIDPHFSDNKKFISPFARFEPTDEGLKAAIETAKQIGKN